MSHFSEAFKREVFSIWYSNGKPVATRLYNLVPEKGDTYFNGNKPERTTLAEWIKDEFSVWAEDIDKEVKAQLDAYLVKEKVNMLQNHAKNAEEMQNLAIGWLKEHSQDLSPSSAVRLWVEGVRIERGSRGIPEALDQMMTMSDEELLDEIKGYLSTPEYSGDYNDEEE